MPPKPFKPPRPAAGGSKPKTKSATSGTTARKSTTPKAKSNGVSKAKNPAGEGKGKKTGKVGGGGDAPRISAASRLSFAGLPSLSPESGDELEFELDGDTNGAGRAKSANHTNERAVARNSDSDMDDAHSLGSLTEPGDRAEREEEEEQTPPAIPIDLLNVLLHQFFKEPNTRMSKGANAAVGRYMETFVREALARVAYEKGREGGGVMEVEDLEKVAPQLLLDF